MRELANDPENKRIDPDYDGNSSDSDDDIACVSIRAMRQFLLAYTYIAPLKLNGIARAHSAFLDETRAIIREMGTLVEMDIIRNNSPVEMRLLAWRRLASTAAYLSDNNLPFSTNI